MSHANAIRYLAHEAALCRDRDAAEALCLLLPALMRLYDLPPMEDAEAAAFKYKATLNLQRLPSQFLARHMHPNSSHEEANNASRND